MHQNVDVTEYLREIEAERSIRPVYEGELPEYVKILDQMKQHLAQMPKHFRKQLYYSLCKEFSIAKWE